VISRLFCKFPSIEIVQRFTNHFYFKFPCETTQSLDKSFIELQLQRLRKSSKTDFWEVCIELHSYYDPRKAPPELIDPEKITSETIFHIIDQCMNFFEYNVFYRKRKIRKGLFEKSIMIIPKFCHTMISPIETYSNTNTNLHIHNISNIFPGAISLDDTIKVNQSKS
jgi:hypothetical protein